MLKNLNTFNLNKTKMQKKIFYWCPFIDKVATVKSVINSAIALKKKFGNERKIVVLNTLGEWDEYKTILTEKGLEFYNLTEYKLLKKIQLKGFFFSRTYYLLIFLLTTIPLYKLIKKDQPKYLVAHLITSVPIILFAICSFKTKLVLRISGLIKFNFFRKLLWNLCLEKIDMIFSPTIDSLENLKTKFSSHKNKIFLLRDPIISISEIRKQSRENNISEENYYIAIGRLTKQKNFMLLCEAVKELRYTFNKKNLLIKILGEGEERDKILRYIKENKIEENIKLLGYKKNVFKYLVKARALISTSLWEDPGFFLIEAGSLNIPVICSDCPNGPKEILDNGNNGYLYTSNSKKELIKIIEIFENEDQKILFKKKLKLKKMIKQFTIFNHGKVFSKYLDETEKN